MLNSRLRQIEALLERIGNARGGAKSPPPRPLQTPQDVIDLLQEQVQAIRMDARVEQLERARVLGYLAGFARRAIETGTLAQRLDLLEAVLLNRKGKAPS